MKLTPETASAAVSKFALMAFFPGDPDIRAALVWALMQFVETDEQLVWLVRRTIALYGTWPGVGELRALYCSRWMPKDGQQAFSTIYPRGIPSEQPQPSTHDAPRKGPVTADANLDNAVRVAAERKKIKPIGRATKP